MKKTISFLLLFAVMFTLCACGIPKKSSAAAPVATAAQATPEPTPIPTPTPVPEPDYIETVVTLDNLFDYYTMVEDKTFTNDDNGDINSMLVNTRLVLKDGISVSDEFESHVAVDYTFLMKVYGGADNYYDGGRKDDFTPNYDDRTFQHGMYIIYQHDYDFAEHDEGGAEIPLYYYTYMSPKQIELPENLEFTAAEGVLYIMK